MGGSEVNKTKSNIAQFIYMHMNVAELSFLHRYNKPSPYFQIDARKI
jgi:hypothetical protein